MPGRRKNFALSKSTAMKVGEKFHLQTEMSILSQKSRAIAQSFMPRPSMLTSTEFVEIDQTILQKTKQTLEDIEKKGLKKNQVLRRIETITDHELADYSIFTGTTSPADKKDSD
jgi:hypothetical protein